MVKLSRKPAKRRFMFHVNRHEVFITCSALQWFRVWGIGFMAYGFGVPCPIGFGLEFLNLSRHMYRETAVL